MKCPNCQNEVSPEWKICPNCEYKPRFCSRQGCESGWLPAVAHFCPQCGSPVKGEEHLGLKGIIESGVRQGLSYEDAKILATSTMIGAGKMVLNNNDKSLDQLIEAVCSKGGTTVEAINVFNQFDLLKITDKAIDACVKRASELEKL